MYCLSEAAAVAWCNAEAALLHPRPGISHGVCSRNVPQRRRRNHMATILIIEDDDAQRLGLQRSLGSAGYTVLAAADGASGIEMARNSSPDLILCDIEMPGLNGFQTLQALKADERTKELPFVFLTGSSDAMAGKLGRKLGAEDFIEKPFSFSKLLAVVTTRLKT